MKFLYLTIILLMATTVSCRKEIEVRNAIVELDECSAQTFGLETVSICYDALVEESRCPANANCVWQGVATGRFTIEVNGVQKTIELSTLSLEPRYKNKIKILGYNFRLINMYPYPGSPGSEVKAEIEITK